MPGVLKRNDDQTLNSVDTNVAKMAVEGSKKRKADEMSNGDRPQINGIIPSTNGVYANGIVADPAMSGRALAATVQQISGQLPPEIEHITYGYLPLAQLITRLTQDTFNGLNQVIDEMADMSLHAPANSSAQTNGTGSSPSMVNVQKKTKMWDFAQDRRTKFIQVLVISQWSRNAEAVSKAIDLMHWTHLQRELHRNATLSIGELRQHLQSMKVPSPDLKTAVEVLSTGKASWLPDLGYLPPEPLTPADILKALRTINTSLSIRLNLHETIPPPFKGYNIGSGRVTFHVQDEFEVDLAIADEDPSSQFYFVDFRFSFSPCVTELPDGSLRNQIEGKTNDVLRREGLAGCYEFLHDLILTHKLSIFRNQAVELARGRWAENLKVEALHRAVVVQYWLRRPGGKSWIEIGVKRNRRKSPTSSWNSFTTSSLAIRWHRHGKEVLEHDIEINLGDLSMETVLKRVIALHTNHIFKETKAKLREGALYAKKHLSLKHKASKAEPANCHLRIDFTMENTVTILQEPVSGNFVVVPPSNLHGRVERELNSLKDPALEAYPRIANLRCGTALDYIETRTRMLNWQRLQNINLNQDAVKKFFKIGANIMRLAFFRITTWHGLWALAVTTSMAGDAWWVVELRDPEKVTTALEKLSRYDQPIERAFRVRVTGENSPVIEPAYSTLSKVETTAAAIASQFSDCRELIATKVQHHQQKPSKSTGKVVVPYLYMRFSKSHVPKLMQTLSPPDKPWCHELVVSKFLGLTRDRTSVVNLISARLITPIPNISTLTITMDSSLAFHPSSGAFAFRIHTAIGEPSIPSILDRLKRIERLVRFLSIINKHSLPCSAVSLSTLAFTYASLPTGSLTATLTFATASPMRISFPQNSPHLRIQDFLTTMLNTSNGFEYIVLLLRTTLPLLCAFSAIEEGTPPIAASPTPTRSALTEVHVLPRSATWYRVRYDLSAPLAYELRLRQRADQVVWFSFAPEDTPSKLPLPRSEPEAKATEAKVEEGKDPKAAARDAWLQLCSERGEGWMGMKGGIVAQLGSVEVLVRRIDEVVRGLATADGSTQMKSEIVVLD